MRIKPYVMACGVLLAATGCIKELEPNIEADILDVTTDNENVLNIVEHWGTIDVYGSPNLDASDLTLNFTLSEGASITPDPASVADYSSPRTFEVTSEDGEWVRQYVVSVTLNEIPTKFDFEHWMQPERMRYRMPYEQLGREEGESDLYIWASGNEAYNFLTNKNDNYTAFPTQPTEEAHSGTYAAKLLTRTTPELSKPIASGSLYIGQFDASKYEPRESTQFGLPFRKKPLKLTGWCKYRSGGDKYKSGTPDEYRIRAVLYLTDSETKYLDGFTIKESPNIVASAEMTGGDTAGEGYVKFDLPFEYKAQIDPEKLHEGAYNLAVMFSSSCDGDVYDGAPGSTLLIDEVEIICE